MHSIVFNSRDDWTDTGANFGKNKISVLTNIVLYVHRHGLEEIVFIDWCQKEASTHPNWHISKVQLNRHLKLDGRVTRVNRTHKNVLYFFLFLKKY